MSAEHRVYTGNHAVGTASGRPFGKCRCGAVLEGARAIEDHKELEKKA